MSTNRRMRRSRLETHYLRPRIVEKDSEGNTSETFGTAVEWTGEVWQASGRVQAEMYGEKLPYIRNIKIQGDYTVSVGGNGIPRYVFSESLAISEKDGLCIDCGKDEGPDYQVISITPFRPLRLEAVRR